MGRVGGWLELGGSEDNKQKLSNRIVIILISFRMIEFQVI